MEDNIIAVIKDSNFNLKDKELHNPEIRYSSRGLVFNDQNEIAVFHKQKKNEYKLPGGGLEKNEDPVDAFYREVFEETGCEVSIIDCLGTIIEEKSSTNFKQVSYVYVAKVINNSHQLNLTEKEKDEGAILLWKNIDEALNLITNCQKDLVGSLYDDLYRSLFMVERDKEILKYYIKTKVNSKNK